MRPFVGDDALRTGDARQTLVFKALCVLRETQEQAQSGRVPPSFGLRFALAYLYAVGRRSSEWFDREPYVEFWKCATQQDACNSGPGHDGVAYSRSTTMQSCVNAIARAAGMEHTAELGERLSKATSGKDAAK